MSVDPAYSPAMKMVLIDHCKHFGIARQARLQAKGQLAHHLLPVSQIAQCDLTKGERMHQGIVSPQCDRERRFGLTQMVYPDRRIDD